MLIIVSYLFIFFFLNSCITNTLKLFMFEAKISVVVFRGAPYPSGALGEHTFLRPCHPSCARVLA